jgi:hypothetical protein
MQQDWSVSVWDKYFINEYIDIESVEIGSDSDCW